LPGRGSAPAERFRLPDGTVFGVIASTTVPFCSACDRSRVTADGRLYTCLYATHGFDLRAPLRAGAPAADLAALVRAQWANRRDRGAEERLQTRNRVAFVSADALRRNPHLEMHTRGG
jgi:cyclic pyranopterin phosphate synthase